MFPINTQEFYSPPDCEARSLCACFFPECAAQEHFSPPVQCFSLDRQQSIHFAPFTFRACTASLSGEERLMESVSDPYDDVSLVYRRLIRQESQEVGDLLDQIRIAFGSRVALRAALTITILKMEILQDHWIPNIALYDHLLQDYPEAVALTKAAIKCCLQSWGIPVVVSQEWTEWASA